MIFFEGTDAQGIEQTTLKRLQVFIDTKLKAEPFATTFSKWRGVTVTLDDSVALEHVNSKKPFVFLSILDGAHDRQLRDFPVGVNGALRRGYEHMMTITAEVITSDFSGAKTGKANPVSSTGLLRDALQYVINENRVALKQQGLYYAVCKPDKARWTNPNLFNPHAVSFTVHTVRPTP